MCCALSSRLQKPSTLYVYSRDRWQLIHRISTVFFGPIAVLQWGYLDCLLVAFRISPDEESGAAGKEGTTYHENTEIAEPSDDDDDDSGDDDCRSVLHRLGYLLFTRNRSRRRSRSAQTLQPTQGAPAIDRYRDDSHVPGYDPRSTALFFVDWLQPDEESGTSTSPPSRHFSDDDMEQFDSGHATPVAYHGTPPPQVDCREEAGQG